ncbi:putative membrane protein [Nocardia transvalensis]|uniref:Putative membrane protein n=1 Tax=Nocardia transvalensis TaxID=37333 RepID=A0A7W9UID7_9NOCA|nr:DUF2142 domain-containing protein [Nocardia transvalensis]MBB5913620.1 putative membrane protein [Nocardia transvalensis]
MTTEARPESVDGQQPGTVGGRQSGTVDGQQSSTVDGRQSGTVDGQQSSTVGERQSSTVGERRSEDGHETVAEAAETPPGVDPLRRAGGWVRERMGAATAAFLVVATLFGAVWATVTPAFWGHDEITQFGRSYQVAHGGFLPQRIADDRGVAYGGDIPLSIDGLMSYAFTDYNRRPPEPEPMAADRVSYRLLESAPVTTDATKPVWFTNTAAYSPIPYVPAAVGIRLAEALDLDVGGMMLLTRLAGLAAYLIIVGFALWTLRGFRWQWLAFAVAVLPIALFQAGTVTADTVTNALALLVSCLLVKGLFLGARLSRAEVAVALAATVLLPLCKPTYVLLAMLTVLIPARQYGFSSWRRWIPWACAVIGAGAFAVWMKIAAPTGDGMGLMRPPEQWHSVRPGDQLHGILTHPVDFLNTFVESIWLRDQRWFTQFFGELGFAYIDVPAVSILACLLAFAVGLGIAERLTSDRLRTWVVALTVLASIAMIYVTLYMSFTPVGYYLIDGVQGRYFVPLAIVAFAVLLRWMPVRLSDIRGITPAKGPAIVIVVATVIALAAAVAKYNYLVWG